MDWVNVFGYSVLEKKSKVKKRNEIAQAASEKREDGRVLDGEVRRQFSVGTDKNVSEPLID